MDKLSVFSLKLFYIECVKTYRKTLGNNVSRAYFMDTFSFSRSNMLTVFKKNSCFTHKVQKLLPFSRETFYESSQLEQRKIAKNHFSLDQAMIIHHRMAKWGVYTDVSVEKSCIIKFIDFFMSMYEPQVPDVFSSTLESLPGKDFL